MPKILTNKWFLIAIAALVAAVIGYQYWKSTQSKLPEGIASGNGRIEAKLVDVAAREPLRIREILVDEGDLVQAGQVVAHLDTETLEAELASDKSAALAAKEQLAVAQSAIVKKKSEVRLARIEVDRSRKMLAERASSQREVDVRTTALETATASLAQEEAQLLSAQQNLATAEAQVVKTQTRIDDATLVSPVEGRVLYRLAEPGEVLGPGGKALTLINLQDVYMEIFLPSAEAAALKVGADARITVDYAPDRSVPAVVTFVSPEAQFTPKQVETRSEREKLMFRVKIQVPAELVKEHIEQIKTGVRGVGYVKVDDSAAWPEWLERGLVRAPPPASTDDVPAEAEPAPAPEPAAASSP
jgi:HlyD family secretion protein